MGTPSVSVIIPSYNHARYLPLALESALSQTLAPTEIVVMDDGSTDATSSVVEPFSDRVRVLSQANSGVSAARNRAVAVSSGELLAFLDADDLWLPRKLELQVDAWIRDPLLGLIHCGVEDVDAEGRPGRVHLDGLSGSVARELLLLRRAVVLGGGSGLVVPRKVFDAIGGFDEQLSTSADWDLFFRIARLHPIGFVPEVLVRYRVHGANMHGNVDAMRLDMLHAFGKAFAAAPDLHALRRRAYGRLHTLLSGSYAERRDFAAAAEHALKAVAHDPGCAPTILGFPLRRLSRRLHPDRTSDR